MKKQLIKLAGIWLNALSWIAPAKAGRKGLELFCTPTRVPMNTKHLEFLNTAEKQTFQSPENVTIQTYRWGSGPSKILFLHGWQSHSYRWKKYIESLDKDQFSVYAMDAPAHGLSAGRLLSVPTYSDAIGSFIQNVGGIESAVCHSMGCFSALYTFHRMPDLTPKSLVLLASPGEAQEFFNHFRRMLSLSSRTAGIVLAEFERVFKRSPQGFSAPHFASSLSIPGLLIHDEDDKDTRVEHSRRILESWSGSKLVVTKGLGHNLRSEQIVQQVLEFVTESLPETKSVDQRHS